MNDDAFGFSREGLELALALLREHPHQSPDNLPPSLPTAGIGELETLRFLAPHVLGGARDLGSDTAFAHMDPPTPWITWAMTQWNAALNQNLLHPDTAPAAIAIEQRVIDWLAPLFGMNGGHMTPGASIANLTALWAAREVAGVRRVIASEAAHLSVTKAAHILGLEMLKIPVDAAGRMQRNHLPDALGDTCVVLTAGTTGTGAIDALDVVAGAAWTHVDAAWGGALRLSERFTSLLGGIENADSVCVSAHKWLFQPKESALILFRDNAIAERGIQFEGAYLAKPNVGVQGSHGAVAAPLLATLLAWGKEGMAERIERCLDAASGLHQMLDTHPGLTTYAPPATGIVVWRAQTQTDTDDLFAKLPAGSTSRTRIDSFNWLRNVAANPNADIEMLVQHINQSVDARNA